MKQCNRCGQEKEVSETSALLAHFVCDGCRNDTGGWEFNSIRIKDMEYEMPETSSITMARGNYNASKIYN